MTERGRSALSATSDALAIGPSALHWDGQSLRIDFNEMTVPRPRRLRGSVRVWPHALAHQCYVLNAAGDHRWRPIAPRARVEVDCASPGIRWSGDGYLDHNSGAEPLEHGFCEWIWSRAPHRDGAVVLYDGVTRGGERFDFGLRFDAAGQATALEPPPVHDLGKSGWRMPRFSRGDRPSRLVRTLEDAPFYARSVVATHVAGEDVVGVHEALSLDRFRMPIVQAMLPFRMPRRG